MNKRIDRRRFAISGSAFAGSFLLFGDRMSVAEERSLTEKRLVGLGINALARAPEMNYFADGHRGAALISAHMMCVEPLRNGYCSLREVRSPTRSVSDLD